MFKNAIKIFLALFISSSLLSQDVVLERSALLMDELYIIDGTAFLEELDNGVLRLRLSDDFSTPVGPDVRIFLNNSISGTGGIEIVNLSDINHFSGELIINIQGGVNIDDYQNIVFFCFQFQQLWASGTWSDSGPPGGGFECEESEVMLTSGMATIDICPSDSQSDLLTFTNTLNLPPTTNYAYLLTDANQILQQIITDDNFNFEGTSMDEQRIYGIHYDGNLLAAVGSIRTATTATGCFTHSSNLEYIEITKSACPPFECLISNTFTTNGLSLIDICASDGNPDIVPLLNSINENPGEHFAFLITDANEVLEDIVYSSSYNFEGTGDSEQRVYGIHFDGELIPAFGFVRQQTLATGCFSHSNSENFLSITKEACIPEFVCLESSIEISSGNEINICPTDGIPDDLQLTNSIETEAGLHYAYLITDENEILQEVVLSSNYDFENSGFEIQRIYGLHYDGDLNTEIGLDRKSTTATGCFLHSHDDIFVTIFKEACPPDFICETTTISAENSTNTVDICPSDNQDDVINLENNLSISGGLHFAYLITDSNENVLTFTQTDSYNFEGSNDQETRVYGIHFDGELNVLIGENRMQTTASMCYEHSSSTTYLTVTKNACIPPFECLATSVATTGWNTEIDICTTDGQDDIVELRNNQMIDDGISYAYLITDISENVIDYTNESEFNFEGSNNETQRVYGIHYEGELSVMIGQNRNMTTSSGCFIHSSSELYLTVTKNACPPSYECKSSLTATIDWVTLVDICPVDGIPDIVELRNNIMEPVGEHYAYLLTDNNQILQEIILGTKYNFEGSDLIEQRIYGINYDGELLAKIGKDRLETTASGCYIHSDESTYLTITKTACQDEFECVESLTASSAWIIDIDICANDGIDDDIFIQNNINTEPGEHYAFLLTDTSEILLEIFFDSIYNFEGLEDDKYRVYGVSYSGQLNPAIGEIRQNTTASGCHIHSGGNLFITVNTKAECIVATKDIDIDHYLNLYPNPSNGLINIDFKSNFDFTDATIFNSQGIKIMDVKNLETIYIEDPGVYTLQIMSGKELLSKRFIITP